MTGKRSITTVIGLLLTLCAATFLPLGQWGVAYSGLGRLLGREVLWWVLVVATLLYVALVERRSFASIGFRRPKILDLVLAIVAGVLMVAGIVVIYQVIFPIFHLQMNTREMAAIYNTPLWYRLILVTRAAVAEELLFRGYPIERIGELLRSLALAVVLSWAGFTYAHLGSWGWAQLIVAGYGGVILTILYLWRRNLWANMLAHWIADGVGFLQPH